MSQFPATPRTRVTRKPDRGSYDRELIYRILDEAFVCHVAFIADNQPFVVPTNYVRVADKLFLHGSTASRLMKTLASGAPFCLSVTLLDGIVFSPTATGHTKEFRNGDQFSASAPGAPGPRHRRTGQHRGIRTSRL